MYFFCRYFRVHQNCGRILIPTWVMVTVTIITQHCIMLPNMAWSICWGNQTTAVVTGERVQKGSEGLIIRWSTEVDRLEYGNRVASSNCCTVIKAVCLQQIWPYNIWHSQCREYSEFDLPSCYFTLKESHPRCVYQNYNGLIINNGSQKHNYIYKYNNSPTTCFGLIPEMDI